LRKLKLALDENSLRDAALLTLAASLAAYVQDRQHFNPERSRAAALGLLDGDEDALRELAVKARTFA
jgi:hypothetical protein